MDAKKNTYDMNRVNLYDVVPLDTPFQFVIEPTFLCNLRCNYCVHSASKETLEERGFSFDSMKWDVFERILEQLTEFPKKIKKVTFSGYGEPLLDKRLPEMIRLIRQKNIAEKILVISNGLLLMPELWVELRDAGLDEYKVSLQGMTAEKYKKICGINIDYDRFFETLMFAYSNKRDCIIKIKIADTALDNDERADFYEKFEGICDYIAIEHVFDQFSFVDYQGKLWAEYERNRFGYELKPIKVCSPMFFKMAVLQDGKITFGCPDGITYEGFNVRDATLHEVWNSPERIKILTDNLNGVYIDRKECINCTRWDYSFVPEDLLDGHEQEILSRMPAVKSNRHDLKKPVILCGNASW